MKRFSDVPFFSTPSTAAQMPTQGSLQRFLGFRVPVVVDQDHLHHGLRGHRCPCCEASPPQTEQRLDLRPGEDRWAYAEAGLVLFGITLLFGDALRRFGLEQEAFELWQWSGWLLMAVVAGSAVIVGGLRISAHLFTRPTTVRLATCARCALLAKDRSLLRRVAELGYGGLAVLSLGLTLWGLYAPAAICFEGETCLPAALDVYTAFTNIVFGVFVAAMAVRWVLLIERGRREPALRTRATGAVRLMVPQSWNKSIPGMSDAR